MGVRPPTNGNATGESVEFGIVAVEPLVRDADFAFPASTETVAAELGGERVPYDAYGNAVDLETVLAEVDRDRFESRRELLNALHPVFETYRTDRGTSVVDHVRSLLPF